LASTLVAAPAVADESTLPEVAFAGVMFGAPLEQFPHTKGLVPDAVLTARQRLAAEAHSLPFKLLSTTDNELSIARDDYLVLSLVVTDESSLTDTFSLPGAGRFHRQFCDLSIVGLIFDAASKRVVASYPVTA
jgi:hypothetical protein